MICHGNGSAYHTCASEGVVCVRWNGLGMVYQVCHLAWKEWEADAVANGQDDLKLVAVVPLPRTPEEN